MDMDKLRAEITRDEGRKTRPYKDTRGEWTAGVGHNLEAHGASRQDIAAWLSVGIPDRAIDGWLDTDIQAAVACCESIFPAFSSLPDNVQRALANMAFDLMYELRDWHGLRAAIEARDWQAAALSVMSSRFAREAPIRCCRLAAAIVEG
jgi:lysozyme